MPHTRVYQSRPMSNQPSNQQQVLQVRYDDLKASYANHVLVSVGAEEVYLDFTSGIVADRPGVSTLPIHTRIAMTPSGVVRLAQLLSQTIQNFQVVNVNPPPTEAPKQVDQPPIEVPEKKK
jgi:hypothetical protein